jgi:hypothetical protein
MAALFDKEAKGGVDGEIKIRSALGLGIPVGQRGTIIIPHLVCHHLSVLSAHSASRESLVRV